MLSLHDALRLYLRAWLVEFAEQAAGGEVALSRECSLAARPSGGDGLPPLVVVDVAGSKHAIHTRVHALPHLIYARPSFSMKLQACT